MKRRAILIESSNTKSGALPGAKADLNALKSFLTSSLGGAWEPHEIVTFGTPFSSDVKAALKTLDDADFAFIAFSGHGCLSDGETCVELNNYYDMKESELDCSAKRIVLLLDVCRESVLEEALIRAEGMTKLSAALPDRDEARLAFDEAILASSIGRVVIYSCDVGQQAADTSSFARLLLRAAESWSKSIYYALTPRVLNLREVFEDASNTMVAQSRNRQTPQADFGRRISHFPFAVHVG